MSAGNGRLAGEGGVLTLWRVALGLSAWLRREADLRRSRRALLDLTEEQLRDVGLTRSEAEQEGRRSLYLD